jgi:hypothetical protein
MQSISRCLVLILSVCISGAALTPAAQGQDKPRPKKPAKNEKSEEEKIKERHLAAAAQLQKAYGKPMAHLHVGADGKYETHVGFGANALMNPGLPLLPELFNVKSIYAPKARVTGDNLESLSKLTELEELQVYFTAFGDAGISHLVALPKLKAFTANHCPITDKGVEDLAKISTLEIVDLTGTQITDAALEHLDKLENLRGLAVDMTRVTPAAWARFKAAHPNLKDDAIKNFHGSKIGAVTGGRPQ